ncbi:hypothetical protein [Streptomyces sp. NPDC018610]|uniref:hypothetical protein n=1 Tax=Streptomyces sp. NPDC018610 TaxID=3365049 RepID=UPI0037B7933F
MTTAIGGLTPFLVPLAGATLVVAVSTWALIRRDRQIRAHALQGRPPYGNE